MKSSTQPSGSTKKTEGKLSPAPPVTLEDAQRTIRLPGNIDTALLQLQVKRRLQGRKCRAINDLILEAVENLLLAEELHPLNTTVG